MTRVGATALTAQLQIPVFGKLLGERQTVGLAADTPFLAVKISGVPLRGTVGAAVDVNLVTQSGMRGHFISQTVQE